MCLVRGPLYSRRCSASSPQISCRPPAAERAALLGTADPVAHVAPTVAATLEPVANSTAQARTHLPVQSMDGATSIAPRACRECLEGPSLEHAAALHGGRRCRYPRKVRSWVRCLSSASHSWSSRLPQVCLRAHVCACARARLCLCASVRRDECLCARSSSVRLSLAVGRDVCACVRACARSRARRE